MLLSWNDIIALELHKPYLQNIILRLNQAEINKIEIFPKRNDILRAFKLCQLNQTRVVIVGQDPYHTPGYAHGLAFSVEKTAPIPKSLQNIFKELERDCNIKMPQHGDLSHWAEQGILLLNIILTVERNKPLSHDDWQWQNLTMRCIQVLNELDSSIIFVLWGRCAQSCRHLITNKKHFILTAAHPSPLSAHKGFFNCEHFSTINQILKHLNQKTIEWAI